MKIQLVGFRRAFVWLGAGWYIFKRNLGAWLVMAMVFLLALMLLGMLPFAGIALIALFIPLLLTGPLMTAHQSLSGDVVQVENALQGFNDSRFRSRLLWLGSMMVVGMLVSLAMWYPLSTEVLTALYFPNSHTQVALVLAEMLASSPLNLSVQASVIVVVVMAFFYATPLILFENQSPLDAVSTSLLACLRNIVPLTVFAVLVIMLGVLASFAFGLGYLVLIPVVTAASYASFRDVFDPVEPRAADRLLNAHSA
ncbi:MAG: hypothetical protein BWK73_07580 [Thiothrix lacustris]|uniref:Transmembrane protein n=1 Tax=Thiothrix lacustris TaxID=525917 RepID=A0A1Y1QW50_9GAMM|nr:MAG: hypothetical protein BWK73_07580 [Thiothrix lacustris]